MNKIFFLFLLFSSNSLIPGTFHLPQNQVVLKMKIIGVKDGDTVEGLYYQFPINIRLEHIDAPEKRQPFGTKSKEKLSDLCFGKKDDIMEHRQNF